MLGGYFHHLWLIPVGILFYSLLYYVSKTYIVKLLCRAVLGAHIHFESQVSPVQDHTIHNDVYRDAKSTNGFHQRTVGVEIHTVSVGDVTEMAQLIVGFVFACISSVFSVVIMYQTHDDIINSQSQTLAPFAHFGAWYYVIDTYTMYDSYKLRKRVRHASLPKTLLKFIWRRWTMIVHHFIVFCIAYPLTVNNGFRGGRGDFILGSLIAQDISTPFLSAVKILRLLGLQRSVVYKLIGLILISTFFVVRVANIPLLIILYAVQHHRGDFPKALTSMTPTCHLVNSVQFLLQSYWFFCLMKIAVCSYCNCSQSKNKKVN